VPSLYSKTSTETLTPSTSEKLAVAMPSISTRNENPPDGSGLFVGAHTLAMDNVVSMLRQTSIAAAIEMFFLFRSKHPNSSVNWSY